MSCPSQEVTEGNGKSLGRGTTQQPGPPEGPRIGRLGMDPAMRQGTGNWQFLTSAAPLAWSGLLVRVNRLPQPGAEAVLRRQSIHAPRQKPFQMASGDQGLAAMGGLGGGEAKGPAPVDGGLAWS